jgi:hypothetical protein
MIQLIMSLTDKRDLKLKHNLAVLSANLRLGEVLNR